MLRQLRTYHDLGVPGGAVPLDSNGHIPRTYRPDLDRYNVKDAAYGAVGDGVTDDTAAIQAAIDAAPAGGAVVFPVGQYVYSALTINKVLHLEGLGTAHVFGAGVFGNAASWASSPDKGVILLCTAASGYSIDTSHDLHCRNLVFKGVGDATRTTTAVNVSGSLLRWDHVYFANFFVGLRMGNCYQSLFSHLQFRGCATGLVFGYAGTGPCNANVITDIDSTECGVAVQMADTETNRIIGGAIQAFDVGIDMVGNNSGNTISDVYFESNHAGAWAIKMRAPSGGALDDNLIGKNHYGGGTSAVQVSVGNGNQFLLGKTSAAITFASGTSANVVSGRSAATYVTDSGTNRIEGWSSQRLQLRGDGEEWQNAAGNKLAEIKGSGANEAWVYLYGQTAVTAGAGFKLHADGGTSKNASMQLDSSGNVVVRNSSTGGATYFDSASGGLIFRNSGFTAQLTVSDAGAWTFRDGATFVFGSTTGTKIGTATSQKLGFWNATPIVQPTTAVAAATFAANTSAIANDTATFDGYTIGQVVKALRNAGLLA